MKLRRILTAAHAVALALVMAVLPFQDGWASQGNLVMPNTGTLAGLTLVNNISTALDALASCNSGASAPINMAGSTAVAGQCWLDTSSSPYKIRINDGALNWPIIGYLDGSNHIVFTPVGGGTATVASATTTDLWSVPQNSVTISGTTNITALANSSAVAGTIKVVKFAGALTLTYNATSLILPTAANITTAAGDTAIVLALSSSNVQVFYFRADGTALAFTAAIGASNIANSGLSFSSPINLRLSPSVSGNALTIALKGVNNADPSPSNPVPIVFRDATLANGDPVVVSIQAATSIVIPATATLGSTNGNPFRGWLVMYYNGGSPVMGVINCSDATNIYPLAENGVASPTNGAANSAGVHYSAAGVSANSPFRIIGHFEYSAGLATAGTYNIAPTTVHIFGPGIKKPGDIVQTKYATTTSVQTSSGATFPNATGFTKAITLTSTINPVVSFASVEASAGGSGQTFLQLYRATGSFACTTAVGQQGDVGANVNGMQTFIGFDQPGTLSAVTYGICFGAIGASGVATGGMMILHEIMGSLEPANDNGEPLRMVG